MRPYILVFGFLGIGAMNGLFFVPKGSPSFFALAGMAFACGMFSNWASESRVGARAD